MDFTKYKGKISNSGSDERGSYSGGVAGDQTGREWSIVNWYSRPWTCVLRHPDPKVRELIAQLGVEAALNNNVGYDQYQRGTYWTNLQKVGYRPSKITTPCEADCSAGVIANTKAVGYLLNIPALKNLSATYTGNMRSGFKAAGFQVLTDKKYLTSPDYLVPGDILLYDNNHTATNLGIGSKSGYNQQAPAAAVGKNETSTSTKEIQTMLIAAGWGLDGTGNYGEKTTAAVKEFQQLYGLPVTGSVNAKTLSVLKEVYAIVKDGFDANYYSNKYADLKKAFGTDKKKLLNHYYVFGRKENREYKAPPAQAGRAAVVTASLLNIRKGPGKNEANLTTYPRLKYGAPVRVISQEGAWFLISISGDAGAKYAVDLNGKATGDKGTRRGYASTEYIKIQ